MQITINVPDNLPAEMVTNYINTIEMQMQLFSKTISETNKQAVSLRNLFKETQSLSHITELTDEEINAEIEAVRNGL